MSNFCCLPVGLVSVLRQAVTNESHDRPCCIPGAASFLLVKPSIEWPRNCYSLHQSRQWVGTVRDFRNRSNSYE